ncbi:hypothetical protein PCANC_04655 [Puccinia coronata f. sp. avenae]|uniref:Uncharacterized protein n=1 Tax=Puccinia coronata f. sp. avenae TaxID=200324 RepID=A0A2N5W1L0_9BASI|nr:hypothetical protein PCANC_04655 [Puccinia coronata f. sp. avenae]
MDVHHQELLFSYLAVIPSSIRSGDALSFLILAKLNEDLWNVVNNIIMNKVIVESPQATLTRLQEIVHLEESQKSKNATPSATKTTKDQPKSVYALMHKSKKGKRKPRP